MRHFVARPSTPHLYEVPVTNPSYAQIHYICQKIAFEVAATFEIDYIIGLTRGGLIPAVIISHLLDVPMIPITYSSKQGAGDDKNHSNTLPDLPKAHYLIVDDICDSGNTMKEVYTHYKATHRIHTAAVFHKTGSVHTPPFSGWSVGSDFGWISFPWEKASVV